MKKFLGLLISLLVISTFTIVSCNSDDDDSDTATCEDGIRNQGEHDVDCGGPCPPCAVYGMSARISGYSWVAQNIDVTYQGGTLTIAADNGVVPLWFITMVHTGPAETGTYALASGSLAQMAQPYTFKNGTITITEWDKTNKTISGTFSMKCNNEIDVNVDNGTFTQISYQ